MEVYTIYTYLGGMIRSTERFLLVMLIRIVVVDDYHSFLAKFSVPCKSPPHPNSPVR